MSDTQFIDADSFQGGSGEEISFREICLKHLQRITLFASVEWRGGYWQEKSHIVGNAVVTTKDYKEDSREIYSNAVDCLSDLLLPYYDEEMKEAENKHIKELEKIDPDKEKTKKVFVKRELFRELSNFLKRIRYLEGKTFDETL